jgi:2-phospho-L-lactate guanylyltransferase
MKQRRPLCAVVPFKSSSRAKQRLARVLTVQQRRQLVHAMLEDVLATLAATAGVASILVVTLDPEAAALAAACGAEISRQRAGEGHTAAIAAAALRLAPSGCDMLTLPCDIPLVRPDDVERLIALHNHAFTPRTQGLSIVPAHDQRGSNAVLLSPADAVSLQFGEDSFLPHLAAAKSRGIKPNVVRLPNIALDIDTPRDLALLSATGAGTRAHALLRAWHFRRHVPSATGAPSP